MVYFILIFGLLAFVIFYLVSSRNDRARKISEEIASSWGQPKKKLVHFARIERYAEIMIKKEDFHQLSRQTMDDIDFYHLFSFVDRTSSSVGQQYLFHRLMHPTNSLPALENLNATAVYLTANPDRRKEIQQELLKLSGADFVCSLLEEKISKHPNWLKYYPLNILLVVVLFLFGFLYPVLWVTLIVPLTINTFLHFWNREQTYRVIRSFPQLNLLIDVSKNLSGKGDLRADKMVHESIAELAPLQGQLGMLGSNNDGTIRDELSQLSLYVVELIKGFLLVEIAISLHVIRKLEAKRSAIAILFNYVGEIDTAISVASIRAGKLKTCTPEFTPHPKILSLRGVYHPMVDKCVRNDLDIDSKSILITGSNMSGKSTFLRTLMINSILAQTLYTCFADEFKTSFLRQFSSIRIDDNLMKGTSYFLEEVNLMSTLVGEADSGTQNIFVLDEVFKGTNTVERIAAAKAILSYLNGDNNIVVVATHDLELSSMLEHEYDLYHFADVFEDGKLRFDHTLRAGRMKGGNAIKLLKIANFPEAVIREATDLSMGLTAGVG